MFTENEIRGGWATRCEIVDGQPVWVTINYDELTARADLVRNIDLCQVRGLVTSEDAVRGVADVIAAYPLGGEKP